MSRFLVMDRDEHPCRTSDVDEDDMRVRPIVDVTLTEEQSRQTVRLLALIMAADRCGPGIADTAVLSGARATS